MVHPGQGGYTRIIRGGVFCPRRRLLSFWWGWVAIRRVGWLLPHAGRVELGMGGGGLEHGGGPAGVHHPTRQFAGWLLNVSIRQVAGWGRRQATRQFARWVCFWIVNPTRQFAWW